MGVIPTARRYQSKDDIELRILLGGVKRWKMSIMFDDGRIDETRFAEYVFVQNMMGGQAVHV